MTANYFNGASPGIPATWLLLASAGIACLYLIVVSQSFHFSKKLSASTPLSSRWLWLPLLGALLLGGALLFLPVVLSPDMTSYIAASQAGAHYYSYPPAGMLSTTLPVLYGPSWLAIVSLLASISNHNLLILTWLLRGIELLAHLANVALIWAILARLSPEQRLPGTLLYAWNPLVLLELAGNGHYDGLVICLLLLAIWLYLCGEIVGTRLIVASTSIDAPSPERDCHSERSEESISPGTEILRFAQNDSPVGGYQKSKSYLYDIAALILIGLAISLNWLALVVAPLLLWFMARYRRATGSTIRGFTWRVLVVLLVVAITYLPVWQGSTTFVAIISTIHLQGLMHSLLALFAALLNLLYATVINLSHLTTPAYAPIQPGSAADISIVTSALFIFILLYVREMGKARTYQTMLTGLCIVMASYAALASTIFWPWYLLWIVWMVALRPYDILSKTLLLCSCTALLYYPMLSLDGTPLAFLMPLCIFGVPSLYFIGVRVWPK